MKDAGCGSNEITEICRLWDAGQIKDAVRLLRLHRCGLMDSLHQSQDKVDCLDYLVYKMEKKIKEKKVNDQGKVKERYEHEF
ncbi:hypothetical protein D7X25_17505 [bacterium 1XD42-8]|nr:hypothetical protein D7X25_17505 [bacterium 1XD42-8]